MPGILGKIGGRGAEALSQEIITMVQSMMHEPFYESGTYVSDRYLVGLGAVFQQESFAAGQPFWNAARDICLVFAGECFGLDEFLSGRRTDDEANDVNTAGCLLALYEQLGISFVEKLNGIFSGALADLRSGQVFLFNDRYGLGRIYFHQTVDAFYFASEAKALLSVLPGLRRLDLTALAEQFSCGCVLQNRSLFPGLSLLPGGSIWTISPEGKVREDSYFDPATWEAQPLLDEVAHHEALRETFSRILPRYFTRGNSLGMSLTGGLDGRMMMAYAPSRNGGLPCYTFGGSYRDCADVTIARRVAQTRNHSHEVLPINGSFLRAFAGLAEKSVYISDGTMDVTGSVELFANRRAREIATVRLTGNYGSEILRRNVAFRPSIASSYLDRDFSALVGETATTYQRGREGDTLSFIAFKQVPWHHYSRLAVEQSQLTVRSPFLDNELVSLAYRAPLAQRTSPQPALRLIAEGSPGLAQIPTDRGLLFRPRPLATMLLHTWREFSARAEYAYDYGMPPWVSRVDHALARFHLERLFLGRHKFYHFRVWYRDQLAPYVKEVLLDQRSLARPYIRRVAVERLVNEHVKGQRNHTIPIHKLLTAELMQRQFIDS